MKNTWHKIMLVSTGSIASILTLLLLLLNIGISSAHANDSHTVTIDEILQKIVNKSVDTTKYISTNTLTEGKKILNNRALCQKTKYAIEADYKFSGLTIQTWLYLINTENEWTGELRKLENLTRTIYSLEKFAIKEGVFTSSTYRNNPKESQEVINYYYNSPKEFVYRYITEILSLQKHFKTNCTTNWGVESVAKIAPLAKKLVPHIMNHLAAKAQSGEPEARRLLQGWVRHTAVAAGDHPELGLF